MSSSGAILNYEESGGERPEGTMIDAAEPLQRWSKYHYPMYKASGFVDKNAQLKIEFDHSVKALHTITVTVYNIY